MGVNVNVTELLHVIELTPCHQNIMLVGKHGIGKSRIIADFFEKQGKPVITLFLGQMSDPGDIIGLPALDATVGKTDFRPPWWFPLDGNPIVLFLDELNRARPEILQCVMDLTLNKMLAGKKLPAGSQIISAVNEGEEYQLTDLDPALVSRFNVYYFVPSPAEWLLWAERNNIDKRVVAFIEKNSDVLDSEASIDAGLSKTPDRRAWERVSQIIAPLDHIDRIVEKIIAGVVGNSAALKFALFTRENTGLNPLLILTHFEQNKQRLENLAIHELTPLNEGCFRMIELERNQKKVKGYVSNLEHYIKWLIENKRNEVIAHWATLYQSSAYPQAKVAILSNSPSIFQSIVGFIKDIKI
ncbi:MAG: AAA family ATPase [Treponema sp.]|nr:AAA family ATPase [Treponema sp.]